MHKQNFKIFDVVPHKLSDFMATVLLLLTFIKNKTKQSKTNKQPKKPAKLAFNTSEQ